MFAVLDTNHFSEFLKPAGSVSKFLARVAEEKPDIFIPIVVAQECFEGWFALINRKQQGMEQTKAYAQFLRSIRALDDFELLPFDEDEARIFHSMRDSGIRIGSMDLKIASICLAHDGVLLTRNLVDFEKIPGLKVENWLD